MKKIIITFFLLITFNATQAQEKVFSRFTYSVHLIFQGYSLPFSKPGTYFQNKGISFSAHYDIRKNAAFQQSVQIGNFFNKYHGRSIFVSTSTSYNPLRSKRINAGISLGAGYMFTGFSKGGWQQNQDGAWQNSSNRIAHLFIPLDVHIRVKAYENNSFILSPSLTYQVNALISYSGASPVLPQSLINIGSTFKIKKP